MRLTISSLGLGLLASTSWATVVNFDDLPLASNSYHNSSSFTDGGATFSNEYFGSFFDGFAYSNVVDKTTPGFNNQYAASTGGGHNGSANYALAFDPTPYGPAPTITLPYSANVQGVYVTNTTYAFLAIRDGNDGNGTPNNGFVRQFGDNPITSTHGNEGFPDLFTVTITGYDALGNRVGSVLKPLADYTSPQNSGDYALNTWSFVDLSALGPVSSLSFSLATTDVGAGGANTPFYFAIDDLTYTPEPTGLLGAAAAALVLRRRRR